MEEQIKTMPVVALRGLTILPKMVMHFDITRPRSMAAVEKAMIGDQRIFLVTQKHHEVVEPELDDLYQVGTIAVVKQMVKLPKHVVRVLVEGMERGELLCFDSEEPALIAQVGSMDKEDEDLDSLTKEAMLRIVKDKLDEYGQVNAKFSQDVLPGLKVIPSLEELLDQIAIQLPWDYTVRQGVLESNSLEARYEVILRTLMSEMEIYRIKKDFQEKVRADIDQNQKEYILREQMKVIRQELGEDSSMSDADEYQKKLGLLKADKETKDKLRKEIERFRGMPAGSQEANVLRTYIETLLELPWKKTSKDNDDLKHAQQILNADHYGLDKVKERILEYLAVRTLTKKGTSPIICLVGPPGTGKTSIARSVARALNKKYVRISLGGVRDEAEIRGHRKTYVGAMPGRIVEGLRQAGVSNPLMLLDEIDKVSSDYKGDTSSALLEVLDSEQNVKFRDHYVEQPIDLSQVLFIATANTTQTIPGPLLDRMELIEVNSYTENEKFHIAKDYLVGKQLERNGLSREEVSFSDRALEKIIHNYTREAGVRNLERRIGDICRKAAREFLENKRKSIKITEINLEKYLGKEKVTFEDANEEDQVGVVRGLAWTSVGGDTLQIEVNVMPGKGNLLMTGQLGDVMKESAQTALTFVRSICPDYQVPNDYFEKHDLHIHIPEGAVPKDGPSAGITMATAMVSAVTGRKVFAKLAMTGEITLRGRVLPIGGLKEKILAARMAHIEKVLVPEKNRPDMAELSREITKGLEIVYVKDMSQVLSQALAS
ncbi:endopeptidase La [Clostridium sp. AF18-27]|uniref:Lon protease n=1 Tax=Enterocloster lavalensis TaxID=460384 RepID=A0A1I0C5Y7_9FIRM|nr:MULTISPECIES: endopeptidase La [Enterocloster]RHR57515.1 endopeptidase La [Clostridium sp. AF18-27]MCB6342241.1 endopeptidase La [Enterocloster lavalensis]MDR3757556.1 endopeptidase La [Enterocloster sp.]PST34174.1 endopeptidase La [Enterocloster lavalensis]SET14765.1 ATP-dependent Lon protease [Enterocloster lavalensis]